MILSWCIYGLIIITTFVCGLSSVERDKKSSANRNSFWRIDIIIPIALFSLLSAFRYNVGVDYMSYRSAYIEYIELGIKSRDIEPLYLLLTQILAYIRANYVILFGILSFIEIFFLYYTFRHEKYIYPFMGLVLMCFDFFFFMNGIRQSISCCILIYAIQLIRNRKLLKYLITILIAAGFHKSALAFIPLYFLMYYNFDIFKNKWVVIFLLITAIPIGTANLWTSQTEEIMDVANTLGYSNYKFDDEYIGEYVSNQTRGARFYIPIFIGIIAALYSNKMKLMFKGTSIINYYILYIIGTIGITIFYNGGVFKRFIIYFSTMDIVIISYLMLYLYRSGKLQSQHRDWIVLGIVVFLSLVNLYAYIASDFYTQYHFIYNL